jgi:2-polyprenyl-3-methyl-5-hydroxy-6-metoxy-1,4-benzoquinol methylase
VTSTRDLADAYNDWYSQWLAELERGPETHELFAWHLAALTAAGDDFVGASVIEISCGDGRLTRALITQGAAEVVAIDLSEVALRFVEYRCAGLPGRLTVQQGDIESIPHPAHSFDVAFCVETLEHVLRPRTALAELKRVLKPGGLLVLTTPNYLSVLGLRRFAWRLVGRRYTEGGQPVNRVTSWPRTALWLRQAGFRTVRGVTPRFGPLTAVRAVSPGR